MPVGIAAQQTQQALRIAARQLPQIGRAFGQTLQQRADGFVSGQQRLKRFGVRPPQAGQPFGQARARNLRLDQIRRGGDAFGQRCTARRHALSAGGRLTRNLLANDSLFGRPLHPTLCTGPPRGKAMTLLSPGWLSASVNSPPCSRATAEARLRPSPEPGCERLCSRRTKRSTTRARSASGMPGPLSATVSRIRSPSLSARTTISGVAPLLARSRGSVYLMALSTRLASAWLTSSRLPLTLAGASASTLSAMPFCSASGSYNSPMSWAISAASNSLMSSRAWPDSARAIISSALKVRISPSESSIVPSSAARYSPALLAVRNASSQRLRRRVSGVLRSCAILSETSFKPCISASMRSSMTLRFSANRSSSSPVPATGSRPPRSPAMMVRVVSVMASTRRSTRRVTNSPPTRPSTITRATDQRPADSTMIEPLALVEIAADQQAEAAGKLEHLHQRGMVGMLGGLRFVEPAVDGLGPARIVENARRQRGDVAGERLAGEGGDEIEARTRPPRTRIDHDHQAADAAEPVLLGQPGDLGIDRIGDLLGNQAAGIEREITEQKRREQRKHGQIDQRQLERGGAK